MKKNTLLLVLSLTLIFGIAVGGTIAWLKDSTADVVNTFTVGDINIDLTETSDLDLKILPGKTITKDPKVTVEEGSEACWLFVKIVETNWSNGLTYEIADGWTALGDAYPGVYYRSVSASDAAAGKSYPVLLNNEVLCSSDLTKTDLSAMNTNAPKLTFTAYAVQSDGVDDAVTAWGYATAA